MPRIRSIPRDRAAIVLRNLYDQAERQFGQVPNFFKSLAHRPELLLTFWNFYRELWTGGVLDPRTKEMAAVRAAALAGSDYFLARHTAGARRAGLDDRQVDALRAADWEKAGGFDDRDKAVLRFAEKFLRQPAGVTDDDLRRLRKWFGDAHLVELTLLLGTTRLAADFTQCFAVEPE